METLPSSSWSQATGEVRHRLDGLADRIKDALLDGLDLDEDDGEDTVPVLPPLSPDEFVERLRDTVEETLRQVAEVINASPGEAVLTGSEEETGDLFAALWWRALQVGVQMRLDAALAEESADLPHPQGEWARRYRQMHSTCAVSLPPSPRP